MSAPIDIHSVSQWNTTLRDATASGQTVVVDCHATWCGPCKTIAPVFAQQASKNPHVIFLRVDVDEMKQIAAKYQVSAMPTFFAIKSGKVVETIRGADPAGIARIVKTHGGPNPPVPALPAAAEEAKSAGNAAFKASNWPEALKKYEEALATAPTSSILHLNIALTHLKSTPPDSSSAILHARKALELDPKSGKAYARLGDGLALEGDGKKEEAKEAYKKAVGLLEGGLMKSEVEKKLQSLL